ncbi:hypothetical protein [Roseibium sp. MMSF_3544]|uniref:hypothetical protein n=1 Tax=unclassified Roseibium TaxID=2629323 RepID=UPI00273FB431|nr:hypothetical protein [Roseibium sp. MMSF_3544]
MFVSTLLNAVRVLRPSLVFLTLLLIIAAFYFPIFHSDFGIIDDHEIVNFLALDPFSISKLWIILINETEVGHPFDTARYRPVYYFVRLIETRVWAEDVGVWYLFRIVIFAYFASEFFVLVRRLFGPSYAIVFFLWMLTSKIFIDIFGRLGPSETYGVLGCAICLTAVRRIQARKLGFLESVLIAVGTLIAIGSKENFVFLLLPLAVAIVVSTDWENILGRIVLFASFVINLLIWAAVLPGTLGRGTNIYQDAIPTFSLLSIYPMGTSLALASVAGAGLLVFSKFVWQHLSRLSFSHRQIELLLWLGLFASGLIIQLFVYRELKTGNRYGFPGVPMVGFVLICMVSWILDRFRDFSWPSKIKSLFPSVLTAAILLIFVGPAVDAQERIRSSVSATREFQAEYAKLYKAIKSRGKVDVVLAIHGPSAYEPVFSVKRFLKKDFGEMNVSISVETDEEFAGALKSKLMSRLREIELNGRVGWVSLKEINEANCISVLFSGSETRLSCPVVSRPWQ